MVLHLIMQHHRDDKKEKPLFHQAIAQSAYRPGFMAPKQTRVSFVPDFGMTNVLLRTCLTLSLLPLGHVRLRRWSDKLYRGAIII